jgi:hypothetical protein
MYIFQQSLKIAIFRLNYLVAPVDNIICKKMVLGLIIMCSAPQDVYNQDIGNSEKPKDLLAELESILISSTEKNSKKVLEQIPINIAEIPQTITNLTQLENDDNRPLRYENPTRVIPINSPIEIQRVATNSNLIGAPLPTKINTKEYFKRNPFSWSRRPKKYRNFIPAVIALLFITTIFVVAALPWFIVKN